MNEFFLGLVPAFIIRSIKNPDKKRKLKKICLQIFEALKTAYAGDPDFE